MKPCEAVPAQTAHERTARWPAGPPEPEPCYLVIPTSIDTIPAMGRGGALPFAAPACLFISLVFTFAFAASVYLPADVVLDETADTLPPALVEALKQSLPLATGMVSLQLLHDAGRRMGCSGRRLNLIKPGYAAIGANEGVPGCTLRSSVRRSVPAVLSEAPA